jgi:hypothetical protein
MLTHGEIARILNRELDTASERLEDARANVGAIIAEVPGMLPQPDGLHRITNAMEEQNKARESLVTAVKRSCEFTVNGIIPEDLE